MNPSIELRIRTMIRAMSDIIIPAIDREAPLAQEQAGLLLGHLQVLLQHEGREQQIDKIEHAALEQLAQALLHCCRGGQMTTSAADLIRSLPQDVDTDTLSHAVESLIIQAGIDGAEDFKRDCDELVLDYARQETLRSRVWFKSMNFDHSPESLGDIESLLNAK